MQEWIPFVYIVINKTTKLKYLGVRYAKNCHPDDLWKTYYTSSSLVKKLINQYGKEDFKYKILHKFPNNPNDAIIKEANYLKFIKKRNNYLNCCYSSGIIDLRISSKAGKVGGIIARDRKIGIFTEDTTKKSEWCSKGGLIGGKKQAKLGLGFHQYKNNPELHKIWSSKGGLSSGQFQNKQFQSEMGKRGGPKNKGFVWINDGIKSYKYTKKEQELVSLEQFLIDNIHFKKGRIVNVKN